MSQKRDLNNCVESVLASDVAPNTFAGEETLRGLAGQAFMSVLDFNPRRLGSIEEYLASLSNTIRQYGGHSIIVTSGTATRAVETLFLESGATLETLVFNRSSTDVVKQMNALLQRYNPHHVHLHFLPLAGPLIRAACRSGANVFASQHGSVIDQTRPTTLHRSLSRIRRWHYSRGVKKFIAPSDYIRRIMIKEGFRPSQVLTIHNGVNLQRHNPKRKGTENIRERYDLPPSMKLVIHIAFAHKQKGIDDFVRSATVVRDSCVPCKYLVVGDGALMQDYKQLSRELGCEEQVIFTGLVNGPTLDSLLAQCDISCLACTWGEAFSLVVLESMARGKVMVATQVGGTPEAIRNQVDGLLVEPGDWQALGIAISELLRDDDLRSRMGRAARQRAEEQFDVNGWVRRTLALYLDGDTASMGKAIGSQ